MFTKRITYTNNASTWNSVATAWTDISTLDAAARTPEEIGKLTELITSEDLIRPSDIVLSEDGTEYSFTSEATQGGLDVLGTFADESGVLGGTITKSMTDWVAV